MCVYYQATLSTLVKVNRIFYAQANMLARKFNKCTDDVKISLFRSYCTSLYTAHLWWHIMMHSGLYLDIQDGQVQDVCVSSNVPTFHVVLRKFINSFMC